MGVFFSWTCFPDEAELKQKSLKLHVYCQSILTTEKLVIETNKISVCLIVKCIFYLFISLM